MTSKSEQKRLAVQCADTWRQVAHEMLQGDLASGAQVTRAQAWKNACQEIVRLRAVAMDLKDWVQPSQDDLSEATLLWMKENGCEH